MKWETFLMRGYGRRGRSKNTTTNHLGRRRKASIRRRAKRAGLRPMIVVGMRAITTKNNNYEDHEGTKMENRLEGPRGDNDD